MAGVAGPLRGPSPRVAGGVETYVDPVNQELVQLPVGWKEYWVNPQGGYLTSDTPGFGRAASTTSAGSASNGATVR